MYRTLVHIAASAGLLLLVGLWPRSGHPVLLALPPGAVPGAAFAVEGWRIQAVLAQAPLTLLVAAPDHRGADPAPLRRAAGALLAIATRPLAQCTPAEPEP